MGRKVVCSTIYEVMNDADPFGSLRQINQRWSNLVDVERSRQISGWMKLEELLWLAERAAEHQCIVELGSYQGRSTRALAENTQGHVHAIDNWKGAIQQPDVERALYATFIKNVFDLGDKVRITKIDHALATIEDTPDMVFIDGDHCYDAVVRDIQNWRPRMRPGGLLCGHDYDNGTDEGVGRAVRELVPGFRRAPETDIWYAEA